MNKIYKVIWSKAKHTYVVASEIAKGHTKGETTGKGLKKLAAALLVAAALLSPNFAWAADTTKVEPAPDGSAGVVEVYTKDGADSTFATQDQLQKDVAATNDLLTKKADQTALEETNANLAKKADQTALDATIANLAKKADQTALDETNANLAKKANQVDLDGKADKATTLEGYGITNAYTKEGADSTFATQDQLQKDVAATNEELVKKANAADVYSKSEVNEADTKLQTNIDNEAAARKAEDARLNSEIVKTNTSLNEAASNLSKLNDTVAKGLEDLRTEDKTLQTNIDNEAATREAGDKTLDDRITAVKDYVLKETGNNYVSKADAAVQNAGVVKADKKIGENVTALGKGLYDETAARIGADAAQDKVIKQVNDNLVASVNTINKNVADGFTALNQAGANEAAAREAKDNELNERITNEANAIHDEIKAGDKVLDDRITNVKEYLEKQTSDNYVSKADASVQDGAIVKAAKTIGENVTNLDAALAKETAARLGADKAQDKVIETVNQNMVDGFNTINKNMSDGFKALNQADANELAGRMAADTKLVEATNGGLSLDNDNVLQKTKTKISSTGEVTTSKEAATTLILNKGAANQVKIDSEGVTVGTSSTQMDAEGFTAGGHDYDAAGAALMSDGRIKGANGDFTVDTDGNVASGNVTSTGTVKGKTLTDGAGASMSGGTVTGTTLTDGKATISNGNIKTNGGFIQTGGGNVNT